MNPKIEILKEKKLVGYRLKMSISDNQTQALWKKFVPKIERIKNRISEDKIAMQIYPSDYFQKFNPNTSFEKWACIEVEHFENTSQEFKIFLLQEGLYAVFHYQGNSNDSRIFQYIFSEWIPHSDFEIDQRPHFEILGSKYKNNDENSEEEIWIPIKKKI